MAKINWDPATAGLGTSRVGYSTDPATGEFTVVTRSDSQQIINANKRRANDFDPNRMRFEDMREVANLDCGAINMLLTEHGLNVFDDSHLDRIVQVLHRPEYRHLRSDIGVVAKAPEREYFRASTASAAPAKAKVGPVIRRGRF